MSLVQLVGCKTDRERRAVTHNRASAPRACSSVLATNKLTIIEKILPVFCKNWDSCSTFLLLLCIMIRFKLSN